MRPGADACAEKPAVNRRGREGQDIRAHLRVDACASICTVGHVEVERTLRGNTAITVWTANQFPVASIIQRNQTSDSVAASVSTHILVSH